MKFYRAKVHWNHPELGSSKATPTPKETATTANGVGKAHACSPFGQKSEWAAEPGRRKLSEQKGRNSENNNRARSRQTVAVPASKESQ